MKALDALNASLFRDRHPDLVNEIHLIDAGGMVSADTGDLTYPTGDGRAVLDEVIGGYVLVWRDATAHWHYIDMSDDPTLAVRFNLEPYVSPDESFLQNVLDQAYKVASAGETVVSWVPWVLGGLIVLELLRAAPRPNPPRARRRYRANGDIEIGYPVEKVLYRKRAGHGDCDDACRANGHRYVHTFEKGFPLVGKANGKLEI